MASAKVRTQEAIAEIDKLIVEFKVLKETAASFSRTSAAGFRGVHQALSAMEDVSNQTNAAFNKLNISYKKMTFE